MSQEVNMPSKAYSKFLDNVDSVTRLEKTYHTLRSNRNTKGRAAWDHITRSAIIFLSSSFEVYIEDIINETISKHIHHANDAKHLPNKVKDTINKYVKTEKNGTPPTDLCDEGWRSVYRKIAIERTNKLNTPKVMNIKSLFEELIGTNHFIDEIHAISELDEIISFRGEIAHRVRADEYVTITNVETSKGVIQDIVKGIDKGILIYLKETYPLKRMVWNDTY